MSSEQDPRHASFGAPRDSLRIALLYIVSFVLPVIGFMILAGRVQTAVNAGSALVLTEQWWSTWQFWGTGFVLVGTLSLIAALLRRPALITSAYTLVVLLLILRATLLFLGVFNAASLEARSASVIGSGSWWLSGLAIGAVAAWSRD